MHLEDLVNNSDLTDDEGITQNGLDEAAGGIVSESPKSVVVTNIACHIFDDDDMKSNFEASFLAFDECATFNYVKSFRRVRVNFSTPESASNAQDTFDMATIAGQVVRCFLTQPITIGSGSPHLKPPKREKQFLISPPASPPVGWEPIPEGQPIINYDILAAMADLAPGEAHELHPASCDQPGIIVHVCEESEDRAAAILHGVRLPQTARPGVPAAES